MNQDYKDRIINYGGLKYMIISSTRYLGHEYLFVVNYDNVNDFKLLVCLNELKEVTDIDLFREVILKME